jgi:TetR/AcrR family transcriptional regulator, cholesterol catabolism regulator
MVTPARNEHPRDAIVAVTLDLLREHGYDGLRLDAVAKRARVSLSTIYKEFPSRDELVLGAVTHWMTTRVYEPLPIPVPGAPWHESLTEIFRSIFRPLLADPAMLAVYVRARSLPSGSRLYEQGAAFVASRIEAAFGDADSAFAAGVISIVEDVIYAGLGRFAAGAVGVDDFIPRLERAIALLAHVPLVTRLPDRAEVRAGAR